jgi:rubrerythrin
MNLEKKIIKKGVEKIKTAPKKAAAMVWTCPMHPEVKSEKPGKCPKCGMNLEKAKK